MHISFKVQLLSIIKMSGWPLILYQYLREGIKWEIILRQKSKTMSYTRVFILFIFYCSNFTLLLFSSPRSFLCSYFSLILSNVILNFKILFLVTINGAFTRCWCCVKSFAVIISLSLFDSPMTWAVIVALTICLLTC